MQLRNLTLFLLVVIMAFAVSPILGQSTNCEFQRQRCITSCTGRASFKCSESDSQASASACACIDEIQDSLSNLLEATTCLLLEKRCKLSCPPGSIADFQCSEDGQNLSQACTCTSDTATDERGERLAARGDTKNGGVRPIIIDGRTQDDGTQNLFSTAESGGEIVAPAESGGEKAIISRVSVLLAPAMLTLFLVSVA